MEEVAISLLKVLSTVDIYSHHHGIATEFEIKSLLPENLPGSSCSWTMVRLTTGLNAWPIWINLYLIACESVVGRLLISH